MNFKEARAYIQDRLRNQLPDDLHYHGYHHTLEVVIAAQKIGRMEKLNEQELILLQTAAWYHDAGFLVGYKAHEENGCKIAEEQLPNMDYSHADVDKVKGMIMATKVPQSPQNHLEEILCDADLEYLGGDNYYGIAETLRKELIAKNILTRHKQWIEMQVSFLESHQYFTETAKHLFAASKASRLTELKAQLAELETGA